MSDSEHLPAYKQLQVMILEDHPFQLKFAQKLVSTVIDREVLTATDGLQAIDILTQESVNCDIVFCDLEMEGMDGIEFIRRAAEENLAQAIVIASAAETEVIDTVSRMIQAHDIKLLGSIKKPFTSERVYELIQLYIKSSQSSSAKPFKRQNNAVSMTPEDVYKALENQEFIPFYQPKINIQTGCYTGVEALARWQHPEFGLISPAVFIPIIEEHGWDHELTQSILNQSLIDCKSWRQLGYDLSIAVNVTTKLINDNQFADFVKSNLAKAGLPSERLIIEITESSVLQNSANSLETVSRLRLQKVQIAVDDFGTGFSSLEQLSKAPFNQLKLDRAFIQDIDFANKNRVIVAHTIDLAKQLNLLTVAEGVEREEEVEVLSELGADEIQGFFFAKPMPNLELLSWLEQHKNKINQL